MYASNIRSLNVGLNVFLLFLHFRRILDGDEISQISDSLFVFYYKEEVGSRIVTRNQRAEAELTSLNEPHNVKLILGKLCH